jgi:hypothetical protein
MLSFFGRRSAPERGRVAGLTASLVTVLAAVSGAALVLSTGACTTNAAAGGGGPGAGMSGMPGMGNMSDMPGMTDATGMGDMPGMGDVTSAPTTPALAAAAPTGTGLSSSLNGYSFVPAQRTVPGGKPSAYAFRITGPDGRAVTRYQPYESAFVICYVIRSDLTGYDYLQPAMREDGTWTVSLPALQAGAYRAFVDFAAPDSSQGTPLVYRLSSTFTVPGRAASSPAPVPKPTATASVNTSTSTSTTVTTTGTVDGYTVSLSGRPKAGVSGPLTLVVTKGGKPIESFQRFLDSYVHLTAFHAGDLASAQLLSLGGIRAGTGALTTEALFPEGGTWRVFAQFDLDGSVHTVALTLSVH